MTRDPRPGLPARHGSGLAGQAGASSRLSGKPSTATLLSRIRNNHLNGSIDGSTFRKTLGALLAPVLGVRPIDGTLDAEDEAAISDWMRVHLSPIVVPCLDADSLAAVEARILVELDPPLNLMHMPPSPVRTRLRSLRRALER